MVSRRAHRSGALWQSAAQPDADPQQLQHNLGVAILMAALSYSPASEPFCRLAAWDWPLAWDDQRRSTRSHSRSGITPPQRSNTVSAVAQTLALVYLYLLWEEATSRKSAATRRRGEFLGGTWLLLVMAFLCGADPGPLGNGGGDRASAAAGCSPASARPAPPTAAHARCGPLRRRATDQLSVHLSAGCSPSRMEGAGRLGVCTRVVLELHQHKSGARRLSWGLQAGAPFLAMASRN